MTRTRETVGRKNPPRGKGGRKDKAVAGTSTSENVAAEDTPMSTTRAPWPRPDGTVMSGDRVHKIPRMTLSDLKRIPGYNRRPQGYAWDSWNSICYNGLLRIEMAPTKFVHAPTLQKMGIEEDVANMLTSMGISHFATHTYPLYPELVRQFIASAELYFRDPESPRASEGTLTFMSSGLLYELSIRDICRIYGFEMIPQGCSFVTWEDCKEFGMLWRLIGKAGTYHSREFKISLIRNPVIRVVAKILGHTFWAKEETGSLRFDELIMLHYGLPAFVRKIYREPPPAICETNLGAIFASILVQRKFRALNTARQKIETIGSLLTPIFMHCGIDLTQTERIDRRDYIDEVYLKNSQIFFPSCLYRFTGRDGSPRHCKLPNPAITSLTSMANIEFVAGDEDLSDQIPTRRQRGSSSRAETSQQEDDPIPEHRRPSSSEGDGMEYIIPPYAGQYALPPSPPDSSDCPHQRWQRQSTRRLYSMLETMWGALAKLRCPPPPSCFRGSGTDTAADTAADTDADPATGPTGYSADLVIYGQGLPETSEYMVEEPDSDSGMRLARRRKQPGASRSASSESEQHTD